MISSLKIEGGYLPYIFGEKHDDILIDLGGKYNAESEINIFEFNKS